jgi:type II secretory pathway pseudopilin PulG
MSLSLVSARIARQGRRGLTLMELVVVMVILIALAGILLPLFPSILTRGHTSSAATNMAELSKAVQAYYYQELQLPNNLDNIANLVSSTTNPVSSANPIVAVQAGTSTTFASGGADIAVSSLTASDFSALQSGGMTNVLQTTVPASGAVGSWSPTYNPYSTTAVGNGFFPQNLTTATPPGASTPLVTGTSVVYVSPYAVARELGQPANPNSVYLLFGAGDYSSLIGKVMQEAPIHFDDSPTGEPNVAYCRFGLIFQTTADGSYTDLPAPRFVGAVDLGDPTLSSIQDHIQAYLNTK